MGGGDTYGRSYRTNVPFWALKPRLKSSISIQLNVNNVSADMPALFGSEEGEEGKKKKRGVTTYKKSLGEKYAFIF